MSGKPILQVFMLLAAAGAVHGQAVRGNDAAIWVATTTSMVHYCIQVDDLLRKTCARAGTLPQPEKNRRLCELPSVPFEARTARNYAEYKEFHRATFVDHEAAITKAIADSRATFERHYARLRSGPFTLLDLDALNREAADCAMIERRWLSPALRKK
jgi:hypothetical protein